VVGDGRGGKKVTVLEAPGRGAALAREEGVGGGVRGERGRRAAGNAAAAAGGASEGGGGGGHRRRGQWVRSVKAGGDGVVESGEGRNGNFGEVEGRGCWTFRLFVFRSEGFVEKEGREPDFVPGERVPGE